MTKKNDKWIETGNFLLDSYIKNGIPSNNISWVMGKSRRTGKSFIHQKLHLEWKKTYRVMKLKRFFNNLNKFDILT
jgi:archaellum biogenesis ATPase FlaH